MVYFLQPGFVKETEFFFCACFSVLNCLPGFQLQTKDLRKIINVNFTRLITSIDVDVPSYVYLCTRAFNYSTQCGQHLQDRCRKPWSSTPTKLWGRPCSGGLDIHVHSLVPNQAKMSYEQHVWSWVHALHGQQWPLPCLLEQGRVPEYPTDVGLGAKMFGRALKEWKGAQCCHRSVSQSLWLLALLNR